MTTLTIRSTLLLLSVLAVTGCMGPAEKPASEPAAYYATVYRTEAGFPHIVAEDFASLGFGTGFAAAQDNVCIMAENILRLRGELSRYLGAENGNLNSDLFRAYMVQTGMYDAPISTELEHVHRGFAAGYNHYLRNTGIDNLPDPTCRGANWIKTMTAADVRRAELTPAFLPHMADLFLAAQPPSADPAEGDTAAGGARTAHWAELAKAMASAHDKGSNGVALGSELTGHSGGLLYANPHLDWDLSFHFFPRHQIIPGVTNLLGANTYERPLVGFGTNGSVAWTNTVTTSRSQALYELTLTQDDPLTYIFDGEEEAIEQINVSVDVLQEDGSLRPRHHTLYASRHGLLLGRVFPWNANRAFALRIADEGNRGQNGQSVALARAESVYDIKQALQRYQATANTNTIAADSNGNAFYGDMGPVANMSAAQLAECALPTPVMVPRFAPAFRGDTSDCEWRTDDDSAAPGLLGPGRQAALVRRDYVTNSNDSYWLANPSAPINNIPQVQGSSNSERTLRTRTGLAMVQQRMAGSDGLPGNTFDADSIVDRMLGNQHYAGQILRDDLVTLCRNTPRVTLDDGEIDLTEACDVLASWDLHANLDSRGAHLFREFLRAAAQGKPTRYLPATLNYAVPFNLDDPVNTPRGLDTDNNPQALPALAAAVKLLADAGIALDAPLGTLQSTRKNDDVIPLHGGEEYEGVFNKMAFKFAGATGYPEVTGSSASWIMAVEFAEERLKARGILSYSISTNPESPHFADMTRLFSRKALLELPYRLQDVKAQALEQIHLREGEGDCRSEGWRRLDAYNFNSEQDCRDTFVRIRQQQLHDWIDQ